MISQIIVFLVFVYLVFFFLFLYVLLFGQTKMHKDGKVGRVHSCLKNCAFSFLSGCIQCFGDSFIFRYFDGVKNYVFFSKNPLMQLFYLCIISGNVLCYCVFVLPHRSEFDAEFPPFVFYFGYVLCVNAYVSFFVASFSNPGIVTKKSLSRFCSAFEYDHVLYQKKDFCRYCRLPKPARAKHCRLTNRCVSKFDHFCPWINNAVGEWNYRWFHYYILSNIAVSLYTFVQYCLYLYYIVVKNDLLHVTFVTNRGTQVEATLSIVLQYMMNHYIWVMAQTFMLLAMGLMLIFFELFHFFKIIWPNVTTYEGFKRDEVIRQIKYILADGIDKDYRISPYLKKNNIIAIEKLIRNKKRFKNIYNKGLLKNLKEIILPRSLRKKKKDKRV